MTDKIEVMARAMTLWVGYMGVLDTMPPGDPGDPRNDEWIEINFRPFLTAAKAALKALEAQGLVVVPREPTKAMIEAKRQACVGMSWPGSPEKMSNAVDCAEWQAMLAALEGKDG